MNDADGKYNIKAISKILGIHPGTLRAWERRYNLIEPKRNDVGHRLYTEEQLKVLKWIVAKVNQGFTIGQAVELLANDNIVDPINDEKVMGSQLEKIKKDVLSALLNFDEDEATKLLDYAFNVFSVEKIIIQVLGPILIEVGHRWEQNVITIAHEHFVTSYIRTKIGMVFHQLPVNALLPRVVCVCAPEERHEIGLLIFTFFLRRRGYDTIYLGTGIPEEDVYSAVEHINPKMVIISCTLSEHLSGMLKLTEGLTARFSGLSVGIGGEAIKYLSDADRSHFDHHLIGDNEEAWLNWLKEKTL